MPVSDRDRLRLLEDIFKAALAATAEERIALIAARCGTDDDLRSEVEALLAHHESSDGPLDRAALGESAAASADVAPVRHASTSG